METSPSRQTSDTVEEALQRGQTAPSPSPSNKKSNERDATAATPTVNGQQEQQEVQRRVDRKPTHAVADRAGMYDRLIIAACVLLLVAMCVVAPLSYVAQQVGASNRDVAAKGAAVGLYNFAQTSVGRTWPLSVLLQRYSGAGQAGRAPPSFANSGRGSEPPAMEDDNGVPLCPFSGLPVTEVFATDDSALAEYAADPSYTRFEDTAMFFRPLPRRVPVSPTTGRPMLRFIHHYRRRAGAAGGATGPLVFVDAEETHAAKERLRKARLADERAFTNNGGMTATGSTRRSATTYGMADIDPATGHLRNAAAATSDPLVAGQQGALVGGDDLGQLPCVHPDSAVYGDMKTMVLTDGYVIHNTYLHHLEDPLEFGRIDFGQAESCLRRLLPLMCVGDKWEVVCPRNLTSVAEQVAYRSFAIHVDIRDVTGVATTLAAAQEALAESVFITATVGEGEGEGTAPFTRAMLLERAKRGPPRLSST